jgi:hypothetical protein
MYLCPCQYKSAPGKQSNKIYNGIFLRIYHTVNTLIKNQAVNWFLDNAWTVQAVRYKISGKIGTFFEKIKIFN